MDHSEYRSRLAFSYLLGVQSHIEEGISTLDGLIPMFAPILKPLAGEVFAPARVAKLFTDIYGSRIHPYALASIATKLRDAKYLQEAGRDNKSNSVIYKVSDSIKVDDVVGESQVDQLFLSFREFANEQMSLHVLPAFSNDELDAAFIARLQSFPLPDQYAWKTKPSSNSATATISLPKIKGMSEEAIIEERKTQWLNAIFSDFVLNKIDPNSTEFESFQRVATGSIVVEAVMNFCDPKVGTTLQNTWFIVDSPLLMDLLDLDSPERHAFAKELFAQMKKANAKLAVYSHSLTEITHNIKSALTHYQDRSSYGAIGIRMISNADFVRRIAAVNQNLKEEVKQLGFTIYETPNSLTAYSYLSIDIENQLANNIGFYNNEMAKIRDASSVASTVRLRGNHRSARQNFASTKYVFVSRNARLAQASENYLIAQRTYEQEDMPAVVTDSSLAAVLWLMYGSQASTNLPYKRLLANCTAIPQTDQNIRDRALNLISDEDNELRKSFQVWSRTPRGAEVMLRNSLGDPNLVTLENISSFIEDVKMAAGEDEAAKVRAEMEARIESMVSTHEHVTAESEREKAWIREDLGKTKMDFESLKLEVEKSNRENSDAKKQMLSDISKLQEAHKSAEIMRRKEKEIEMEETLNSLVLRFSGIQKFWDIFIAWSVGIIAAIAGISGLIFDKFYTISTYWDTKFLVFLYLISAGLVIVAFGKMPTIIFQNFIDNRKKIFLSKQLALINKLVILDNYEIDFRLDKFWKK